MYNRRMIGTAPLAEPSRPVHAHDGTTRPAAGDTDLPERLFHGVTPVARRLARPLCCVAIDAEEDFDWMQPVRTTGYSTECMRGIVDLQEILAAYAIRPTYLLTYPVLDDPGAVATVRHQYERGQCDIGVQLHPWVTPPFDENPHHASYLGSLGAALEERKLLVLMDRFRACFAQAPIAFRAGRYGLSQATTGLLEKHGFEIDTSLAPRTDFSSQGGPDFSDYECVPFWFGRQRRLLELPLCRSLVGWAGGLAPLLYRAGSRAPLAGWHAPAVLSRLRCAERVTLSPEGNDAAAMLRLLRHRLRGGQDVFSLSFHSSSLAPGRNPYVRSKADLHAFYDRLSATLDAMARYGFEFATVTEMPGRLDAAARSAAGAGARASA